MILSLPFWLISVVVSLLTVKPKVSPNISLAEKVATNDLSPSTAIGLPRLAPDEGGETISPNV